MLRFYTLGAFELLDGDPPAVRLVPWHGADGELGRAAARAEEQARAE
jgi:hypothetical protein